MDGLRQFRTLTFHYGLYQLAVALAGGFVGAYLLREGFSLPAALVAYAALLLARFGLRFLTLAAVRRLGPRRAMAVGVCVAGLQFVPLCFAESWVGLGLWIATVSVAESLYWPTYHAAAAVTGGGARRGRELGLRTAVGALVGFLGPLIGGLLLARFGPAADFGIAGLLCALSAAPAITLGPLEIGDIPTIRDSLRGIDFTGVVAFAADGWIASGLALAWPMVLFGAVGARYDVFGAANALACLAGAATGLACGGSIDRGGRDRYLVLVSWALAASFALRAAAGWSGPAAALANATGAAVMGLYTPVLMTGVYERAKRSGAAFRFHFAAEAGWDMGAALGCLACAATAWATRAPSLAVLPAALGVAALYWCVRGHADHRLDALPSPAAS